jgi:hypothetical protein
MLNVFVSRVFELARREREHGERLCDRHRGDFGTDLLGESDTVLNRLGGEVQPVGRDQYILVQGSPPPSHLPGDFLIPLIRLLPSDLVDATK